MPKFTFRLKLKEYGKKLIKIEIIKCLKNNFYIKNLKLFAS
jgi:hypothetical protein